MAQWESYEIRWGTRVKGRTGKCSDVLDGSQGKFGSFGGGAVGAGSSVAATKGFEEVEALLYLTGLFVNRGVLLDEVLDNVGDVGGRDGKGKLQERSKLSRWGRGGLGLHTAGRF